LVNTLIIVVNLRPRGQLLLTLGSMGLQTLGVGDGLVDGVDF
jgi:hypothetical protein